MLRLAPTLLLALVLVGPWGCRGHRGRLHHWARSNTSQPATHAEHPRNTNQAEADTGTDDNEAAAEWFPAYSEFNDVISNQCMHGSQPLTTVEMQTYAMTLEECADRKRAGIERKLSSAVTKAAALQKALLKESCFVQDLLGWSHEGVWDYGTRRPVDVATCYADGAIRNLYFVQALKNQQLAQYSAYVEFEQAEGARAAALLENIRERGKQYANMAPEEAGAEGPCARNCVMFDAEWRQVLLVVEHLQTDATALAEHRCSLWPELEAKLGGTEGCRAKMRSALFAESGAAFVEKADAPFWRTGKLEDGTTGVPKWFASLPPTKDSAYGQFASGIYDYCEPTFRNPQADRTTERCFRSELASRFKTLTERVPSSKFLVEKWSTFAAALCAVEGDAAAAFSWDFLGQRWPLASRLGHANPTRPPRSELHVAILRTRVGKACPLIWKSGKRQLGKQPKPCAKCGSN